MLTDELEPGLEDALPGAGRQLLVKLAEQVFAVLANAELWPAFFPDFVSARYTTDPPLGVGTVNVMALSLQLSMVKLAWSGGAPQLVPLSLKVR